MEKRERENTGGIKLAILILAYIFLTILGCFDSSRFVFLLSASILLALAVKLETWQSNIMVVLGIIAALFFGGRDIAEYICSSLYIPVAITGFFIKYEYILIRRDNIFFRTNMANLRIEDKKIISTIPLIMLMVLLGLGYIIFAYYVRFDRGLDIVVSLQHSMDSAINVFKESLPLEKLEQVRQTGFFDILGDVGAIWPIYMYTKFVLVALMLYYVSILILTRYLGEGYIYPTFENIYFPNKPGYMLLVFLLYFVVGDSRPFGLDLANVIENFTYVITVILFIEGLSFVVFYLKYRRIFRLPVLITYMGVFAIIFLGIFPAIVSLGFVDSLFNLRVKLISNIDNFGGKNDR